MAGGPTGRRLSKTTSHRRAMFMHLARQLLHQESLITTDSKAKELRSVVERLITLGKDGTLPARRRAIAVLQDDGVVRKLFTVLAPRFATRQGGYTRIIKYRRRPSDATLLSIVRLVE